jgi:DNA repair exonuclease SbcCD nuclease subunit
MNPPFQKALILTDLHFGRGSNNRQDNEDNLEFLRWAIDEAKTWGANQCIMLGDWHDNRHSLQVSTMLASLDGMDLLNDNFMKVWWIVGNHDLLYRDNRSAASIEFARWLPNIEIIRDPLIVDDCAFLPWLMPDEHKTLDLSNSRYVFAHLEVAGFLRNAKSVVPEGPHSVTTGLFNKQDTVFTGHFHKRQIEKNICFVGSVFPFDFRDEGDTERGLMLLHWGHDPIFKTWPSQPLYRSMKLTQLLHTPETLRQNMTVRLMVDMPLEYKEAAEIRDYFVNTYGLRKLELNHSREDVDQIVQTDSMFQTVDQIVEESLSDIESVGLSNQRLLDIYHSLI